MQDLEIETHKNEISVPYCDIAEFDVNINMNDFDQGAHCDEDDKVSTNQKDDEGTAKP